MVFEKKIKPRDYQVEAVDSARLELANVSKTLIISPTASGKSIMVALMASLAASKGNRVLCLCMQGEILQQNETTLNRLAPEITTGIYCAGQGRKDTDEQVIFASRDSLGVNPLACGAFSLVVIDEAHLVSANEKTTYKKILTALNPSYVVGYTGTPWRMNGGNIWGDSGYFDSVAYNIPMSLLVERGYLSTYRYPAITETIIDASDVKVSSTGDYNKKELDLVTCPDLIVNECIDAWERHKGNGRHSLFFCTSLAHAEKVHNLLLERGYAAGYLDGKTNKKTRKQLLEDAKAGRYECLVNVGTLTTGVDIPCIDTIVHLRPTKSVSLYIQMSGRGLRTYEGKDSLLILDFAGNVERFGADLGRPVVNLGRNEMNGDRPDVLEEAGEKECPKCKSAADRSWFVCPLCGHKFVKIENTPYGQLVEGGRNKVKGYAYYRSKTKKDEDCYVVAWDLGRAKPLKEWLLTERVGYFGDRMRKRLETLQTKRVEKITIEKVCEAFPNITRYHTCDGEPVAETGEVGASFGVANYGSF